MTPEKSEAPRLHTMRDLHELIDRDPLARACLQTFLSGGYASFEAFLIDMAARIQADRLRLQRVTAELSMKLATIRAGIDPSQRPPAVNRLPAPEAGQRPEGGA